MKKKSQSKPKKAAAKKSAKKSNLKNLSQTHGKTEEKEKYEPTTLDQVWGDEGLSVYGTLNEEEYQRQLDEFNRSDLQTHASKIGVVPLDDRNRLTKTLMSEFRKHVSKFRKPSETERQIEKDTHAKVRKLLSDGR
tara:strand:- start:45 stop:452 length:408 start_codon:yes stop_codon:yes gene_type:complete